MEILSAILLALALLLFFWSAAAILLFPLSGDEDAAVWILSGECPELEYRLRGYRHLTMLGTAHAALLLVDCGLSPESRRVAELFCRDVPDVTLADGAELLRLLELVGKRFGAGAGNSGGNGAVYHVPEP